MNSFLNFLSNSIMGPLGTKGVGPLLRRNSPRLAVLHLYEGLTVGLDMSAGAYKSGIRKLQLLALVTNDMEASRASVRLKAAARVTLV